MEFLGTDHLINDRKILQNLIHRDSGFTLVELLVTISILAVLFGIVTLSLGGVGSDAEDTTAIAECGVVQSAIDIYMANDNISSITQQAASGPVTSSADFAPYIRSLPSEFDYTWDTDGNLTCSDVP